MSGTSRHPIETESYRLLATRLNLAHLPGALGAVIARVAHATADLELARSIEATQADARSAALALAHGAQVVCDVEMLRAGVPALRACCHIRNATAGKDGFPTRSATGMRIAGSSHPHGAVFAVGCAPTALNEVLDLMEAKEVFPAAVIALPVGFVGAQASKERAIEVCHSLRVPVIANRGERGGSAPAAAVLNALHLFGTGMSARPADRPFATIDERRGPPCP
jgi:precorrin-8X/cobalt-precorrin-8 methylmutase